MPKPVEDIRALLHDRRHAMGKQIERMIEIKDSYNGDLVLPLPEIDTHEASMVANLVQMGIDQTAMRIASTTPTLHYYPDRPGKAAAQRARKRRDINQGWWDVNRIGFKDRRRARWLLGYACAPITVRPGGDREPEWRLVDPLACFPAPTLDPDELLPPDSINVYKRSREWLNKRYPQQMTSLRKREVNLFEIIEYVDTNEIVMAIIGAPNDTQDSAYGYQQPTGDGGRDYVEILRVPNRANRPLTVVPGRITLDRRLGQYDGALGMMHAKSMFMALGAIAQRRAIFPETWLISSSQGEAQIVQDAEPMSGQVGIVVGATDMKLVRPEASAFTGNVMDRLEYETRHSASIPAEFGGSSTSNIRTGRRGGQVMEAAIDFPIQEAQEILAASKEEENKIAIAVAKAYYGAKPVSMYVKGRGQILCDPRADFESDAHEVRYAYAGADANALNIAVGQKIGIGTLSKETAMGFDPMIQDVETEMDKITAERVKMAYLASIETLASNPDGPWQPEDFSRFTELVLTDKKEPYEAAAQVIKEMKERQLAQQQQQAAPEEMMPGMAQPGAPGAPMPAIPEAGPSVSNLTRLLGGLRLGSDAVSR